ncbi:Glycine cleavage system transcriptional activator [Roseovarius litorisediminis]|uniref:Glycine cleavage system transcriptional activator n=1 Tax=Roseovarius litorisediminis TaxID=1312363 RepID=A0A1Y5R7U6_9RHOB|nr:LysR family transcriptional regulator [Roseovarius litorisediminis]SLN11174.1 Glycine cleavage system transcriptional activator [Roseovarius litorisediminis]
MRITHLNALRALEATLRKGNFTAAAKELGVTPAAVGQRIQALEDYIGRSLFERSATGATPTAEARKMQPALNAGFSALAGVLEDLQPEKAAKRVLVTMPESFAENWFALVVSEFTEMHPQADLRLDASNRDYDLSSETFDFAIRYGKSLGDPFEETLLFGDSVQPVCSPEFACRHGLHPGMRDLSGVPLIHVLNRTGDPNWIGFDEWGRTFGIDPSSLAHGIRFSKAGSGLASSIAGEGLVMAGLVEAFHALADGRLTMPFGATHRYETTYKYRLVRHRDVAMSFIQRTFATWFTARAQQHNRDLEDLLERCAN